MGVRIMLAERDDRARAEAVQEVAGATRGDLGDRATTVFHRLDTGSPGQAISKEVQGSQDHPLETKDRRATGLVSQEGASNILEANRKAKSFYGQLTFSPTFDANIEFVVNVMRLKCSFPQPRRGQSHVIQLAHGSALVGQSAVKTCRQSFQGLNSAIRVETVCAGSAVRGTPTRLGRDPLRL
jgi:hypothetical protein